MQDNTGLYFRREDYAAIWRRFLIDIIDLLTVGTLCVALFALLWRSVPNKVILWSWMAILFGYFVILKSSRLGTLGYRVAGVRIVGLNGQSPSLWNLTVRMMFLFLGPFNYVADLIWLSGDPHRQALRDKFAQTYVIRKKAMPAGTGTVIHRQYFVLGWNFLFREIESGPVAVP
jgi:uncharacterized RDD family membrane protein YckC